MLSLESTLLQGCYLFSTVESSLSLKQRQQLSILRGLIAKYEIEIHLNEPFPPCEEPVSLDVEHDERGTLVLIGLYLPSSNRYFGYTVADNHLHSLNGGFDRFIAHNWTGDFDSMRMWGINLTDEQLAWDTMTIGHILDSSLKAYGLKDMCKRELQFVYPEYDEIVGTHKGKTKKSPACPRIASDCCGRITLDKQPLELTVLYNVMDCFVPAKLMERQKCQLY